MRLGVHLPDFTYAGGPTELARDLARIARTVDDTGFEMLSVMDHVWQIWVIGPIENDMLEAYTTLGYLAAHTEKVKLLAWVTAAVYREPGLLAKCVTTLDVLSQGRAWLGIGAAWNEEESVGLGLPFPSTAERFDHLRENLEPAEPGLYRLRDEAPSPSGCRDAAGRHSRPGSCSASRSPRSTNGTTARARFTTWSTCPISTRPPGSTRRWAGSAT